MAPLLEIEELRVAFVGAAGREVAALRGVSLAISRGEFVGLVGESGAGKSVTALAATGLLPHTARILSGSIRFDGAELVDRPERELRAVRGRRIGFAFQDPGAAASPVLSLGAQLIETIRVHRPMSRIAARAQALDLCRRLALPDAEARLDRTVHDLSGGQRQRAMLALALAAEPDLLIADEPTSAVDATIRTQVLELLEQERRQRGLAILLITHDLGVVAARCDRLYVIYAGEVVESGPASEIVARPWHPYTERLVELAIQARDPVRRRRLPGIDGPTPSARSLPAGCAFAPRCQHAQPSCVESAIALARVTSGERSARCIRPLDLESL